MKKAALNGEGANSKRISYLVIGSAKIALTYLLFGILWILLSDAVLASLVGEEGFKILSSYKGIFFVLVCSLLLYLLVNRFARTLEKETKSAEELAAKIAESEQKLSVILNSVPGYIYIKGLDFKYQFANHAVCEYMGKTQDKILGRSDYELLSDSEAASIRSMDEEVVLRGRQVVCEESRIRESDGKPITLLTVKIPLYDREGNISGLCGVSTDISESYLQKQALTQSEARLQLAVNAAMLVVLEYHPDTRTLTRGGLCQEVLGIAPGSGPIEEVLPNVHEEDRKILFDSIKSAIEAKQPFEVVIRILRASGTHFIKITGSAQEKSDGAHVLMGVAFDFTQALNEQQEAARAQLRRSALFVHAVDGVVMFDSKGIIIEVNESFSKILGIDSHHLIGRPIGSWFSELTPESIRKARIEGQDSLEFEFEWLIPEKGVADIEVKTQIGTLDAEEIFICTCRDITLRRDHERSLVQREDQFRSLIESSPNGIILLDNDGRVKQVNRETERLLGYNRDELLGKTGDDILLGSSWISPGGAFDQYWADISSSEFNESREIVALSRSGESLHIELGVTRITDSTGEQLTLLTLVDSSDRWKAQEQIRKLAFYDELTGLPNRHSMIVTLERMIEAAQVSGQEFGLMLMDVNRFRDLNDAFGHGLGDIVLRIIADRLKDAIESSYVLARVGGDDFALIIWDGPNQALSLDSKADAIQKAFHEPISVQGIQIYASLSIGACVCPSDGTTMQALFGCLESSLYQAKKHGRGKYVRYTSELGEKTRAKHLAELEIRRALQKQEFLLHYQPIINIITGKVIGAEALIRWQHPERGLLGPYEFIETCEESNLIIPLGRWVMIEACKQAKEWQDEFDKSLRISINFSAKQFVDACLIEDVDYAIKNSGVSRGSLQVEITESHLMDDPDAALAVLWQLKNLGVSLAIDDFGTGYSSFGRLKTYPIDCLKVEKAFVQSIFDDQESEAICRSIIGLAHNLKLSVVAEGVETLEQEEFLRSLDCEFTQGFFRGRPLSAQEFTSYLAENTAQSRPIHK